MEIETIAKIVETVDGFLSDKEGEFLYNTAKNCKGKGVIVEIGSWKGKSTIWLAKGSKAGNRVEIYAIDPHIGSSEHQKMRGKISTFEEFKRNIKMAKVDDVIIPIVKTSEEAVKDFDKPIEFLFIDGAHEYELVELDFRLWFPKLVNSGIIALHDTIGYEVSKGPKKIAEEYVYKSRNFRNARFVDSMTFAQKVKQNSMNDRLKNSYVLFLKYFQELNFPKPKSISKIGNWILQKIQ